MQHEDSGKLVEIKEKDNMEGLSFDNILGEQEIENLFMEPEESTTGESEVEASKEEEPESGKENISETNKTTEVVDPDDLFEEEEVEKQPESVGSEKNKEEKEKEGSTDDTGGGTSPQENFYSSIANAMAEDGIFPNLDSETISKADSAEALSDLIEAEVNARLDEKQQRVSKALENGVEPDEIRMYETTLNNIASIKDSDLTAENEKGEQLRYNVIFQDFLNKGYSRERADKLTRRSIDAGTDIEDAKEALQSNKEFFQGKYDKLLQEAEQEAEQLKADRKKQSEKLKDSLLKDKTLLGDMEISKDMRQRAFDCVSKPIYKNPETGEYMTAVQKYEQEHPVEFIKYVGLFMALTNDFKDFDSLAKGKVKKEVKKGLRELEQVLTNTRRNQNGSLKLVTSAKEDPESYIGHGFKLDLS